ncbi:MAG: sugar phosphate isomerase/epimerase [Pirellulales bacterium]|nr:sugar phosphate isomerase/epimerase [Pirellulales bacterium]
MRLCLSQVCTLHSSFEQDVEDYASAACKSLEVWLGKLENYLEQHSLADVKALLQQHEVTLPVAAFQGGLLDSQGEKRREHWEHFSRRLELCQALQIEMLIIAADISGPLSQQDLDRTTASLSQAAAEAAKSGVRLALEFQARSAFCNNLQTCAALVAETGSDYLGICLDAFHFAVGPSKTEDLGYLTADNLFHVQLSDVAGVARELATDSDRILPGEGDFHLEPLIEHLQRINYSSSISIELMNPQVWQNPPAQFAEIAMTALRKLLGLAKME